MSDLEQRRTRFSALGLSVSVLAALLFILLLSSALMSVDYGYHWDEWRLTSSVSRSAETGILLPGLYHYPSVSYWLTALASVPETARYLCAEEGLSSSLAEHLGEAPGLDRFRLSARTLFCIVTLLAPLWVFLLLKRWRGVVEAAFGALLVASSWEVIYHSRWIAPDGIPMQCGALSMFLMYLAIRSKRRPVLLLVCSAIACGFCCGSKYPGGVLILPLLVATHLVVRDKARIEAGRGSACYWIVLCCFAASFLVTTPGALLEPSRFSGDLLYEMGHYGTGHGGYTATTRFEHFHLLAKYIALVAFSRYWPISLLVFVLACVGACDLIKRERALALWFLSAPAAYLAYFVLSSQVMMVRNYLLVFPFLAVLAAVGLRVVCGRSRVALPLKLTILCMAIACNSTWAVSSAQTVARRQEVDHVANLRSHLADHPGRTYWLSGYLPPEIRQADLDAANLAATAAEADYVVFSPTAVQDWTRLIVNRFRLYNVISTTWEVNLDYYPTWEANFHLVAVDLAGARKMGLLDEPQGDDASGRARQRDPLVFPGKSFVRPQ